MNWGAWPAIDDAHYLFTRANTHNLDEREYLNRENISITELIGKGKNQKSMAEADRQLRYAAEDADVAWRLTSLLEADLDKSDAAAMTHSKIRSQGFADLEATGIRLVSHTRATVERHNRSVWRRRFTIWQARSSHRVAQTARDVQGLKLPILSELI